MRLRPQVTVQLVHIQGPLKGQIQEFTEDAILIGRDPAAHVRFPSDVIVVSRKHAEIVREGNRFKLIDLSANGTLVNGKSSKETYLKDGDVLTFAEGGPKVSFLTRVLQQEVVNGEASMPLQEKAPLAGPPADTPEFAPAGERPPSKSAQPTTAPVKAEPVEVRIINVPLVIQYGPTLRSFKELPVTLGKHPGCDFTLDHPEILDRHVQIFYARDAYWVKDLTGQQCVRINGQSIGIQAMLQPNDEIALTVDGPTFLFLGEGRLAEQVSSPASEPATPNRPEGSAWDVPAPGQAGQKRSFIKKIFGH